MAGAAFDASKAQCFMAVLSRPPIMMYNQDPANLRRRSPQPILPEGRGKLTAWVQMQDFILDKYPILVFYGFIAVRDEKSKSGGLEAIRGTSERRCRMVGRSQSTRSDGVQSPRLRQCGIGLCKDFITTRLKLSNILPAAAAVAPNSLKQVGSFIGASGGSSNASGPGCRFSTSRGARAHDRGNGP